MQERRQVQRSRTYIGAVIAFNNRKSAMDCLIRNLSPAGAMVTFTNTAILPDKFDLTIDHKQRSFRARAAWRRPHEAGLEFVAEHAGDETIPLDWARRLRRCEDEKARLLDRIEQLSTAD